MVRKLITFLTIRNYCDHRMFNDYCWKADKKCSSKICFIWAKLPLAVAQWEDASPILEDLKEIVGKTTLPKNKK